MSYRGNHGFDVQVHLLYYILTKVYKIFVVSGGGAWVSFCYFPIRAVMDKAKNSHTPENSIVYRKEQPPSSVIYLCSLSKSRHIVVLNQIENLF